VDLFFIKLIVTPSLVALMSLAARRWGATFGGLIMGLPWMTGPILFFMTFERGLEWCASASLGATVAVIAIAGFLIGYAVLVHRANPLICWLGGTVGFALPAWVVLHAQWSHTPAAATGIGALVLTRFVLLPRPRTAEVPRLLPWWDIPMRMAASAVMVVLLSAVAEVAGARTSGLVASYPTILTCVGLFTHFQWGGDALLRLLAGLSLSLISFVVFFVVVAVAVEVHGLVTAYALAAVCAVITSAALIAISSRLAGRSRRERVAVSPKR